MAPLLPKYGNPVVPISAGTEAIWREWNRADRSLSYKEITGEKRVAADAVYEEDAQVIPSSVLHPLKQATANSGINREEPA